MGVIFVNRFYSPDEPATAQLLSDLAESLAADGRSITVVARRPADRSVSERAFENGVTVVRLPTTNWGRQHLGGRAIDFLTFHLAAFAWLLAHTRSGDSVVALTDPPMIGVTAWAATRVRGARLFHWVQDIYPEIAIRVTGRTALSVFCPWRNKAWRSATACVVPGRQMAATLVAAGVPPDRVHVLANWAPRDLTAASEQERNEVRKAWRLDDKFVAVYSGNLGRVHELQPILEVATHLCDDARIHFLFIGRGAQRRELEQKSRQRALTNVTFIDPQPLSTLSVSLSAADVHFVTLKDGCEPFVFPSKLYGAAAVSRPVIAIASPDTELHAMVGQHGLGIAYSGGQTAEMAKALQALAEHPTRQAKFGEAGQKFAQGGRARAADLWSRVLENTNTVEPCDASR